MTHSTAHTARRNYTTHHWGINPTREIDLGKTPWFPPYLTQMGELVQLDVLTVDDAGQRREYELVIPQGVHLAFSPSRPRRLYVVDATGGASRKLKRELWRAGHAAYPLQELNDMAPGRWAAKPFPPHARGIPVQPVGYITCYWYASEKGEDTPSTYKHKAGEESGILPVLAVDTTGQLWIAGGNYKVEPRGVVD